MIPHARYKDCHKYTLTQKRQLAIEAAAEAVKHHASGFWLRSEETGSMYLNVLKQLTKRK